VPPAAGLGSPWKKSFDLPACSTLKRARRITAQATYSQTKIQSHPVWLSSAKYIINAGATPKEMASTSESSCSPNGLPVFVARAMRPSNMSQKAAVTMYQPARTCSPREAATMAKMPKNRLPSVKPLGSITSDGRGSVGRRIREAPR